MLAFAFDGITSFTLRDSMPGNPICCDPGFQSSTKWAPLRKVSYLIQLRAAADCYLPRHWCVARQFHLYPVCAVD